MFDANEPGRMLARALHASNGLTSIPKLKGPYVRLIRHPKKMNSLFLAFYKDLYNLPSSPSNMTSNVLDYISKTALPTIPTQTIQDSEHPFSEDEVAMAVSLFKRNKSRDKMVTLSNFINLCKHLIYQSTLKRLMQSHLPLLSRLSHCRPISLCYPNLERIPPCVGITARSL